MFIELLLQLSAQAWCWENSSGKYKGVPAFWDLFVHWDIRANECLGNYGVCQHSLAEVPREIRWGLKKDSLAGTLVRGEGDMQWMCPV